MYRFLVPLALLSGAGAAQAVSWFPTTPGLQDKQYLLHYDGCGFAAPLEKPTLRRLDRYGEWQLDLAVAHDLNLCDPAPGTKGKLYAFEIPDAAGGHAIRTVRVVEHILHGSTHEYVIERPVSTAMPRSVAGTWTLDGAPNQGLFVAIDDRNRMVASFNTFDATGRPAWLTGIAPADASAVSFAMANVASGRFAGALAETPSPLAWGDLDVAYEGCGQLRVDWTPLAGTALSPGGGRFRQLTAAATCSLAEQAARCDADVVEAAIQILP